MDVAHRQKICWVWRRRYISPALAILRHRPRDTRGIRIAFSRPLPITSRVSLLAWRLLRRCWRAWQKQVLHLSARSSSDFRRARVYHLSLQPAMLAATVAWWV